MLDKIFPLFIFVCFFSIGAGVIYLSFLFLKDCSQHYLKELRAETKQHRWARESWFGLTSIEENI